MNLFFKYAFGLAAPFSLICILLLCSTGFFCIRRYKTAGTLSITATFLLFFFGYNFFAYPSLTKLENAFPPLHLESLPQNVKTNIRHIVVLGAGHISDERLPVTAEIGGSSLYRLTEGIRLFRKLPGTLLVFSGYKGLDSLASNAEIVGGVARELGIPETKMIIESRPRTTREEAALLAPLLGSRPFILVTSAAHMPRAMKLFQKAKTNPIPAPTDYIIKGDLVRQENWLPQCRNLYLSKRILYEKLARVKAWIINRRKDAKK